MANANESTSACTQCGTHHNRKKPWNGQSEDLCDICEKARVDEIRRISDYHEWHPDECCWRTYLGRNCCMAPTHSDVYRANFIENGERFYTDFRASSVREAREIGREEAGGWGGECISVRKIKN
jgi:hypothetical protein